MHIGFALALTKFITWYAHSFKANDCNFYGEFNKYINTVASTYRHLKSKNHREMYISTRHLAGIMDTVYHYVVFSEPNILVISVKIIILIGDATKVGESNP